MPQDTTAEPMEDAQLPMDPMYDPTPEVSLAADIEMPEAEEGQFPDVTPDVVIEEELNYEDVMEEEAIDEPGKLEPDPQEANVEDSDAGETDKQKTPIS